jgi:succinoglycan biosynthesis transport protein ExoP
MTQTADFGAEKTRRYSEDADAAKEPGNLLWALGVVRRRTLLISAGCAAGLGYGVYSTQGAAPAYTASAVVLFHNPRMNALRELYNAETVNATDAAAFDSQVEILRSAKIARTVIGRLNLTDDQPAFAEQPGLLERLLAALRYGAGEGAAHAATHSGDAALAMAPKKMSDAERTRVLVGELQNGLGVHRIRRSWAVEFSFTSSDPEQAAKIANAYVDAYLAEQLDAKYEAARQAGEWLQNQISELKQKAIDTDRAIQAFKTANNLQSAGDTLVDERRFDEINRQLIEVQADVTRLDARYQHIKSIIDNHRTEAVVSEIIGNALIENLRSKYLDASKREAEISRSYGKDHEQAIKLRKEMQECEIYMFKELVRIAESYHNELEIANTRQKTLTETAKKLTGKTARDNATLAELRDLERKADTYRTLHRNALQRYEEVLQQQSFPFGGARLISAAIPPLAQNRTRRTQTILTMTAIGGLLGGGLGAARELADRSYRTGAQVRQDLDLEFFGPLYRVDSRSAGGRASPERRSLFSRRPLSGGRKSRAPKLSEEVLHHAVQNPLSSFADTLNAVRICADQNFAGRKTKHLGVVSVLPGEGRSAVSHNLAELLADMGVRTLLIDANLRNSALTRLLAPEAQKGLVETVAEGAALADAVVRRDGSRLAFLPAPRPERVSHTSDFLSSAGMKALLTEAEASYDYVILDLPPTSAVVDNRAIAPLLNGLLLVVEWGKTPNAVVRRSLEVDSQIRARCLGVVLNKVNLEQLRLYEQADSREYHLDQCAHYHQKPSAA